MNEQETAVYIEIYYASTETGKFEKLGVKIKDVTVDPEKRTDENAAKIVNAVLPTDCWVGTARFITAEQYAAEYEGEDDE
jgi:hypothetical protein